MIVTQYQQGTKIISKSEKSKAMRVRYEESEDCARPEPNDREREKKDHRGIVMSDRDI